MSSYLQTNVTREKVEEDFKMTSFHCDKSPNNCAITCCHVGMWDKQLPFHFTLSQRENVHKQFHTIRNLLVNWSLWIHTVLMRYKEREKKGEEKVNWRNRP